MPPPATAGEPSPSASPSPPGSAVVAAFDGFGFRVGLLGPGAGAVVEGVGFTVEPRAPSPGSTELPPHPARTLRRPTRTTAARVREGLRRSTQRPYPQADRFPRTPRLRQRPTGSTNLG